VAHFDVHFFLKPWTSDERRRISLRAAFNATTGAASTENATQAAVHGAAASTAAFLAPPPSALLPAAADVLVLDPDSIVPSQGAHWVPASDWAAVYRGATHTGLLGAWSGISYMIGTFDGSVTFAELMVSVDKLGALAAGRQSRTEEGDVPQPAGPKDALLKVRDATLRTPRGATLSRACMHALAAHPARLRMHESARA
jgi:hypothetical protein